MSSSSFRRGRGQLPPSPGRGAAGLGGGGGGEHRCLTRHTGPAATSEKGAWHQTVYIKVGLTFDVFYVGLFVVLCEPCCYHPLLVVAVTLSVYDGCVAGGGRPGMPGGLGPGRVTEQSTHPARPENTEQLQLAGGAGRWQLGALTRSRSQSATSPGTRRTGPGTRTRPRHPPLSRSGSRHGHAVTVQHTDTCECWGAVLISSLHNPSPGRPGSRLLSLLGAICQARVDNLSPPPFTSCQ